MPSTPNWGLPYPDDDTPNDIAEHLKQLADTADDVLADLFEAVGNTAVGEGADRSLAVNGSLWWDTDEGGGKMFYRKTDGTLVAVGGGATAGRETVSIVTTSIALNETWTGEVTLSPGYRLLRVETTVPARVRAYTSAADRTSDATRSVGIDPTPPHGVILDLVTTASVLSWWTNPAVDGYTADATGEVPVLVTNLSPSSAAVTVTFTFVRSE